MVLRPAARYAAILLAAAALSLAGYVAYQAYSLRKFVQGFSHTPLPESAESHEFGDLLVGEHDAEAMGGLAGHDGQNMTVVGELPPWTWTSEPAQTHASVCDGEWKAGCEPPRWCDGTLTSATLSEVSDDADPRVELAISRVDGMNLASRTQCRTTIRPSSELRLQVAGSSVVVFSRSEESLLTWQYDSDCTLVATRAVPAAALRPAVPSFRELPLVPRRTVTGHGLYFRTDANGCETTCGLQIHEAPFDARHSEHELIAPQRITTGASRKYIWWAYWNDTKWFLRVIDRETHLPLLADEGTHENVNAPISGLRVVDDLFTLALISYPKEDVVRHHKFVYELPSGARVADEQINWGIPSKRREQR